MSRIYFHSPDGDAEILGSERAYMGNLINRIAISILDPKWQKDKLMQILPDNCYLKRETGADDYRWAHDFDIWLSVSSEYFMINGKKVEAFALLLNTAYKISNDAIRLMTRIHGQSELHCWIPGKDRKWIATIIESGLQVNLFRKGAGWDDVIKLLNLNSKVPVVLSYSVCDGFPNACLLDRGEKFRDKFYEMPADKQWRLAFAALKKKNGGLKICKETWNNYYFRHGITAMDIINE